MNVTKTAYVSPCGTYRYHLTRTWDYDTPPLVFVMLNPSTADASVDDPTIRRCVSFALREKRGGIIVLNLYAWRATDPKNLPGDGPQAQGPENPRVLMEALESAAKTGNAIVCAWGAHSSGAMFVHQARKLGAPLVCLGMTKAGRPRHPLYLPLEAGLVPYGEAAHAGR